MEVKKRLEKLKSVIETIGDQTIYIVMTQVDPDAVAVAFGLAEKNHSCYKRRIFKRNQDLLLRGNRPFAK